MIKVQIFMIPLRVCWAMFFIDNELLWKFGILKHLPVSTIKFTGVPYIFFSTLAIWDERFWIPASIFGLLASSELPFAFLIICESITILIDHFIGRHRQQQQQHPPTRNIIELDQSVEAVDSPEVEVLYQLPPAPVERFRGHSSVEPRRRQRSSTPDISVIQPNPNPRRTAVKTAQSLRVDFDLTEEEGEMKNSRRSSRTSSKLKKMSKRE